MQPRPSFDRTLLILIAIGVVSILGIGWLFLTSDLREIFIHPTAVLTAIPFDIGPLQTEAASLFPSATPAQDETLLTVTATGPVSYPGPSDARPAATSTLVTESRPTPTPSISHTPDRNLPLSAGRRYDDTEHSIAYDTFWTALQMSSTVN